MTDLVLACVLAAVPALLWRRCGPLGVRLAGFAALLVVAIGVLDPKRSVVVEQPVSVVAVSTGPEDPAAIAALRARIGDENAQRVTVAPGGPTWIESALGAALRDGPRERVAPVVLWTGPFVVPSGARVEGAPVPDVLSDREAPAIEPADCRVAPIAPLRVGRPGTLEVLARAVRGAIACRVEVRDGRGDVVVESSGPMPDEGPFAVAVLPERAGKHTFVVELSAAGTRVSGTGELVVAPARLVTVVGARAPAHAAALRVQGHEVRAAETVPDDLGDTAVLVLVDPLDVAAQERVVTFVEDGGGLFVVGGEDGGGLARDGEPLHPLLPINWQPPPQRDPDAGGDRADPNAPPADETPPKPPEPPPVPPVPPPEPPPAGEAVTGNTGGAQPTGATEEVEVERRSIAMVLVIDRSGSMDSFVPGGRGNRMDYAKLSAYATAQALEEGDEVAVVSFGVSGQIVLPLTPATERQRIRDTLEGLRAMDNTTLLAGALELTRDKVLAGSRAAVKHVVVITDGEIYDIYPAAGIAAKSLRDSGATVSLIKILASPDELSRDAPKIAEVGGGTFYRASSASKVPFLVSNEVRRALGVVGRGPGAGGGPQSGDAPPTEAPPKPDPQPDPPQPDPPEPDPPQPESAELPEPEPAPPAPPPVLAVRAVTRSPLLEPRPPDGFPSLAGILQAAARPEARVLLVAGDDGVPLLAFANRGLGKVGAWSADFLGAWGAAWREDAGFPGLWSAWITTIAAPLPEGAAVDHLATRELAPPAPVRAERAFLTQWNPAGLRPIDSWSPPAPRTRVEERSAAHRWAAFGALALVSLALFEWIALRRGRF